MPTVVWEHVSYQLADRCQMSRWCLRRPVWVVQVGRTHRLSCRRHCPS